MTYVSFKLIRPKTSSSAFRSLFKAAAEGATYSALYNHESKATRWIREAGSFQQQHRSIFLKAVSKTIGSRNMI